MEPVLNSLANPANMNAPIKDQFVRQAQDLLGDRNTITAVPQKFEEYSKEVSFRISEDAFNRAVGRESESILQRIASITVKPDGLIYDAVEPLISFMDQNGFRLFYSNLEHVTPSQAREIWRFQWNVATLDRMRIFDAVIGLGKSLTLYFLDTTPNPSIPATTRLRTLKGSAVASLRDGNSLRDNIKSPNRLLTLIHAPDEPIDIVREVGILQPRENLLEFWESIADSVGQYNNTCIGFPESIESTLGIDGLEAPRTTDQAFRYIDTVIPVHEATTAVRSLASNSLTGNDLTCFDRLLYKMNKNERWAVTCAASFVALHDRPNVRCTIDEDGVAEWTAGIGHMII